MKNNSTLNLAPTTKAIPKPQNSAKPHYEPSQKPKTSQRPAPV